MNDQDIDRLLEQGLSGDLPGQVFRSRVLMDSTAAFIRARRTRTRWHLAALSAAAVFIAGMSFVLGRCSISPSVLQPASPPVLADAGETVAVPGELVTWLQAARFFRQLGMEERVALAYDRASKLVPYDANSTVGSARDTSVADVRAYRRQEDERSDPARMGTPSDQRTSAERTRSIIAQSFGG